MKYCKKCYTITLRILYKGGIFMSVSNATKEYDVVVIGAGNGGLTAAAWAAKKGLKVLLCEQHNLPGGFASSFVRGRFEFEPSLHELSDIGEGESKGGCGLMFDRLGLDVEWNRVPEAYRLILTEHKADIVMPFGIEEYVAKMEHYVPNSRQKTEEFISLCQEVVEALAYLAESKGSPDKKYLIKNYGNFMRTASYSVEQVQNAMKIPQDIKNILNAYWCYLGIPVDRLNFTVYAAMFYKYVKYGAYIPTMRSHEISAALDAKIREFGGEIAYNTRVEKILVDNNRVTGVVTHKGETIKTKHVIANVSPHNVYGFMIEPHTEVPQIAKKSLNARRVGSAGFVLYLGLNKSPEELGLTDYSYFIYPNMDTNAMYDSLKDRNGNVPQATICLNAAIPNCSPKGTTIMSFTTLFSPYSWNDVKEEDYFKEKNRIADKILDNFEQATGIRVRDCIEEFEVATPLTFARYTGAYGGSIYGYEPDSWDSALPRMMMMEQDIYIKGLRFSGGSAFRIHGYGSSYLSGETAALLTLKDIREGE